MCPFFFYLCFLSFFFTNPTRICEENNEMSKQKKLAHLLYVQDHLTDKGHPNSLNSVNSRRWSRESTYLAMGDQYTVKSQTSVPQRHCGELPASLMGINRGRTHTQIKWAILCLSGSHGHRTWTKKTTCLGFFFKIEQNRHNQENLKSPPSLLRTREQKNPLSVMWNITRFPPNGGKWSHSKLPLPPLTYTEACMNLQKAPCSPPSSWVFQA